MSPPPEETIPLSHLSRALSNSLHADLTALLATLTGLPPTSPARRDALLAHLLSSRHAVARLLVATRWTREHTALAPRAEAAEAAAQLRASAPEAAADGLWGARRAAGGSAVGGRAKGDHGGRRERMPAVSTQRQGLGGTEEKGGVAGGGGGGEALKVRRAAATRAAVRAALPFVTGLVMGVEENEGGMDVVVGVVGAWKAVLELDSSNHATAVFGVVDLVVLVDSDVDAPGQRRGRDGGEGGDCRAGAGSGLVGEDHVTLLRRLAGDRLAAAAAAMVADATFVQRNAVMLAALRDLMNYEVCAPMALDRLRAQAAVLAGSGGRRGAGVSVVGGGGELVEMEIEKPEEKEKEKKKEQGKAKGKEQEKPVQEKDAAAGKETQAAARAPLVLKYWPDSRHCATIRIAEARRPRHDPSMVAKQQHYQQQLQSQQQKHRNQLVLHDRAAAASGPGAATGVASARDSSTRAGCSIVNSMSRSSAAAGTKEGAAPTRSPESLAADGGKPGPALKLAPPAAACHVSRHSLEQHSDPALVVVTHDPPLPGVDLSDSSHLQMPYGLHPSHLNLEALLLSTMRARAVSRLSSIADALDRQTPTLRVPRPFVSIQSEDAVAAPFGMVGGRETTNPGSWEAVETASRARATRAARRAPPPPPANRAGVLEATSSARSDGSSRCVADTEYPSLTSALGARAREQNQNRPLQEARARRIETGNVAMCVRFLPDETSGVLATVSSISGGLRIRVYGAASLAANANRAGDLGVWKGDKHAQTDAEEETLIAETVRAVRNCMRLEAAARSICALDIGLSDTLPPGTASVAATASACSGSQLVPPCAPVDRLGPKRFLTLSPAPESKEQVLPRGSGSGPGGASPTASPVMGSGGGGGGGNSRFSGDGNNLVTSQRPSSGGGGLTPPSNKRPRLAYATTKDDALVFFQESSVAEAHAYWTPPKRVGDNGDGDGDRKGRQGLAGGSAAAKAGTPPGGSAMEEADSTDRYDGTASAAAAWGVTHDFVDRRLRRVSLLRAFAGASVASAAVPEGSRSMLGDEGDMEVEMGTRTLLKLKCEPLPVRRAELLLRGNGAWQVRLSLLPPIFDSTNDILASPRDKAADGGTGAGEARLAGKKRAHSDSGGPELTQRDIMGDASGNLWSVGVACVGSTLTFTYPSANAAAVRSFFRDLTRARTAAALARGLPSSRFYKVLRRSPVRIVVGVGPYGKVSTSPGAAAVAEASGEKKEITSCYVATVEYVYGRGNSGGFSMIFSPPRQTMQQLAPLIEDVLDSSGGQVGGILAGLLERACPVAAAAESAVRVRGNGRVLFVNALRVRAQFSVPCAADGASASVAPGGRPVSPTQGQKKYCVDMDARGDGGLVKVIDVARATSVMVQQGLLQRSGSRSTGAASARQRGSDYTPLPKWDEIIEAMSRRGAAQMQKAGTIVIVKMEELEQFLTDLVTTSKQESSGAANSSQTGVLASGAL